MVIEHEPIEVLSALWNFFQAGIWVGLVGLVLSFLVGAFRHGPLAAGDTVYSTVRAAIVDMARTSPRRIAALARLAIVEAIRKRLFLALGVYFALLMFAPWFLDAKVAEPAGQYLGFVLDWSWFLALLVALLLSTFSLPQDIKQRTIYTIVTKPVRPAEIVLGRIVGFAVLGSALLFVMGLVGYLFVLRSLSHTHTVSATGFESAAEEEGGGQKGRTSTSFFHNHEFNVWPDGTATVSPEHGHWHDVTKETRDGKTVYTIGGPRGMLVARVPVYGDLRFKDRRGRDADKGISVGKEFKYRSFLVGNSQAAGVWTFEGVTPSAFPQDEFPAGLPLEMSLDVFRAYQGDDISKKHGVLGSYQVRNPKTGLASQRVIFRAREGIHRREIPWQLKELRTGRPIDLMDDLVADGAVEISIQCLDHEQYFGIAEADMYLHARDASFAWNFVKAFVGIWLQMVLVIAFGVMFSTFLSGPVALLSTVGALVCGLFAGFILDLAEGKIEGGGPVEAFIRIVRQDNVMTKLEEGLATQVVQNVDFFIMRLMKAVISLLPDFRRFDNGPYLVQGFDVPPAMVYGQLVSTLLYVLAVALIGYFFLKTREVAK